MGVLSKPMLYKGTESLKKRRRDGEDQGTGFGKGVCEEEKDPKITDGELKYLELRQRLKETIREQRKKESGSVLSHCQENKELPNSNYGSFFGPSQPAIAQRVIEEVKAMLELDYKNKRSPVSTASETKPGLLDLKMKAQKLRETRDYSFLFSDSTELPVFPKLEVSFCGSPSAQGPSKGKQLDRSHIRKAPNGLKEMKHVSVVHQLQPSTQSYEVFPTKRLSLTSSNPRKRHTANVVCHPVVQKGLPSKTPAATVGKTYEKIPVHGAHGASFTKLHPVPKQHSEERREFREPRKGKVMQNQLQSSSKHQVPDRRKASMLQSQSLTKLHLEEKREFCEPNKAKEIPKQLQLSSRHQLKHPGQEDYDEDDGDISSLIRRIFRYDPKKFEGVDYDNDCLMESNFDDIQMEERKSAKIARKEDEIERQLNEREERQERLRRESKKLKLH